MSKVGSWIILVGAAVMFTGLCALPGAFGEHPETSVLLVAISGFCIGALIVAGGIYLKALGLQGKAALATPAKNANAGRRIKGGCDLCGGETPVVQCKVHQLHLCGECLAKHYDFRSCAYVPSLRKAVGKPSGKSMAARAYGA